MVPFNTVPAATKKVKEPHCWFDPTARFFTIIPKAIFLGSTPLCPLPGL
jgi:hypothetical protein